MSKTRAISAQIKAAFLSVLILEKEDRPLKEAALLAAGLPVAVLLMEGADVLTAGAGGVGTLCLCGAGEG